MEKDGTSEWGGVGTVEIPSSHYLVINEDMFNRFSQLSMQDRGTLIDTLLHIRDNGIDSSLASDILNL